jgi:SAM-dependent methyltransferase
MPAALMELLNALCSSHVHAYLASNGVELSRGRRHRIPEVLRALGVLPKFEKFATWLLSVLAEDGIARLEGETFELLKGPDEVPGVDAIQASIHQRFPGWENELKVLAHCVRHYPLALTGKVEAITVLYPDGTPEMLRPIIERGQSLAKQKISVRLIRELVARRVREAGRRVRILEVGGGAGLLTWDVAEALRGLDVEFVFTDLGRSFVLAARREAERRGLDFMRFAVLDASKAPGPQGHEERSFDIVLAYNVIHATPDVSVSMGMLGRLLAPGGQFYLMETTRSRRWTTLVWGLAEGWWYYQDGREGSPFLPAEAWMEVMRGRGYERLRAYPARPEQRAEALHAIIVGEAPAESGQQGRPERLRELEALGAQVLALEADVASREQLRGALERAGELHGVIHAAGGRRARVDGWKALDEALRGTRLDFALTVALEAGEAAATRTLEALVAGRAGREGPPWLVVRCEPEAAGARSEPSRARATEEALRCLASAEGLSCVTVSIEALRARANRQEVTRQPEAAPQQAPELPSTYVAPHNEQERVLCGTWEELLGVSPVGIQDDFLRIGGDSLLATQLLSRLRGLFQVELSVRDFMLEPTVTALSARIDAARAERAKAQAPGIGRASRDRFRAKRTTDGRIELKPEAEASKAVAPAPAIQEKEREDHE